MLLRAPESPLAGTPAVATTSPVHRSSAVAKLAAQPADSTDLEAARATSAWAGGGAKVPASSAAPLLSQPTTRLVLAVSCALALLCAAGGVGYAIARGERAAGVAGPAGGGDQGRPSESRTHTRTGTASSTVTRTGTPSTTLSSTASHTNGASASDTATQTPTASVTATCTPTASVTPTGSTSETSAPTRSAEPSATPFTGVLADAAAFMVTGARTSFLAFGDWGRCHIDGDPPRPANSANCNRQRSMVNAMEEWATAAGVSAIISTGDQFYEGPDIDDDLVSVTRRAGRVGVVASERGA